VSMHLHPSVGSSIACRRVDPRPAAASLSAASRARRLLRPARAIAIVETDLTAAADEQEACGMVSGELS